MRASRRAPLATRCLLLIVLLAGCAVVTNCARASSLVLGRTRGGSTTTSTEAPKLQERVDEGVEEDAEDAEGTTLPPANATTKSPLTGVPQNDYKYDPNLPRELNGYNLSDYPFFNSVPEDIDFNCEGLKDGFYASVPHKCQLYHHCLYGTRYDFLCANYTAFDQRTFICHFVSEVDCVNSPKFFNRNEALYKQDSTTTSSTTTTSTTPAPSQDSGGGGGGGRGRGGGGGRRRRPSRKRPVDFYDEYDDYDYEEPPPRRGAGGRRRPRPENRRPSGPAKDDYDEDPPPRPSKSSASTEEPPLPTKPNRAVFEKPRSPPRIRPPVPVNEREKFLRPGEDLETQSRPSKQPPRQSDEDYEEYEDSPPPRKNRKPARVEDDYQEEEEDFRRTPPLGANGRPLRRNRGPSRRRPSRYEEYDDESDYRDEPRRKRPSRRPDDDYDDFDEAPRRKRPSRTQDDVTSAGSLRSRSKVRPQYTDDYEDEPPRRKGQRKPSTTTTTTTSTTTTTTERPTTSQRPRRVTTSTTPYPYDDDYYYDEESFEEEVKPAPVAPSKPIAKPTEVTPAAVTEASTEAASTKRTPFIPRKTTPLPDAGSKSTMKFSQFKATDETEETPYVFKIDDYVKPTTRAPFIPRGSKAPSTETENSEGPELKEPAPTRRPKPNWQPSQEEDPKPAVQPSVKDVLPPRPAAFTPRQKATTSIPIEATYDDYPNNAPVKAPIKETSPQRPVAFAPRPKVTPVAVAPPQQPTAEEEDYPETQKVVTRTPSRLPPSKPQPPVEPTVKEDNRYIPLSQYKPISQSAPSAQDENTRGRTSYNNSPRFKPSAPDFTSPAADLIPPRGKIGTPPSDIASKSPGAPPPRSRLSTSFLPRGLSPVGGARSKLTSTTAAVPDIDDEEDDAINDALHPTGSDASSTISSQRFSPYQTRSRNPQPIRGGSYYNTEQTTAASQATFTRIASYDDYSDNPPRSRYNAQVALPFPTTALDTFARQPSAPSSFRAAAAIRPPQQARESATRSERRPIAAAASVQYSTQQEPASSAWGPRDYFYTY